MTDVWIKLLFTYGPFALLVFLVFVIERKAKAQLREGGGSEIVRGTIYTSTWLAIFVISGVITWVWIEMNVPQREVAIRGRLTGFLAEWDLRSPASEMYIRRIYDTDSRYDFAWRIVSQRKLSPNDSVQLYIDRGSRLHEDVTVYELPIQAAFYEGDREVILVYQPDSRALMIREGDKGKPLRQMSFGSKPDNGPSRLFTWAVHAQQPASMTGITSRLESNDAVVRISARNELAASGSSGIAFIQEVLSDPSSSYRQKLGVIVALNNTAGVISLSAAANCSIVKAAGDTDPALREAATTYVTKHPDTASNCSRPSASNEGRSMPPSQPPTKQPVAQPQTVNFLSPPAPTKARFPEDLELWKASKRLQIEGQDLLKSNKTAEAAAKFAAALNLYRSIPDLWVDRARAIFQAGLLQEALADLNFGIPLRPNMGAAYDLRAQVREKMGDREGALSDHKAHDRYLPIVMTGMIASLAKRPKDSIKELTPLLRQCPECEDLHRYFGVAQMKEGNFAAARESLDIAIKLDPLIDTKAYEARADVLRRIGETAAAERDAFIAQQLNSLRGNTTKGTRSTGR